MKHCNIFEYLSIAVLTVFLITGVMVCGTSMAQEDTEVRLNTGERSKTGEKLVVTVDVFSGRPNPSFEITEPNEIIRLRGNLTKLPALAKTGAEFSEFGQLGYRGVLITNPSGIEGIPRYVQVLGGKVKVSSGAKGQDTSFFMDVEAMEKYYLQLAKEKGLIPQDLLDKGILPDPDTM